MKKGRLTCKDHNAIVDKVREYIQINPDAKTRDVADEVGITLKTARNTIKEAKIQVSNDNLCFAYDVRRRICKVLTQKDKDCGTRKCAFYKTAEEFEEGRQKAIKMCEKSGYLYGDKYRPPEK